MYPIHNNSIFQIIPVLFRASLFICTLCVCVCVCVYVSIYIYICLVKAMVFPVVMYGCESWTVKKAEH